MFVTFALSGAGIGCCLPSSVDIVCDHFGGKGSAIPLGISFAGVGTGMVMFPVIDEYARTVLCLTSSGTKTMIRRFLFSEIGWRKACLVQGTLCSSGMLLSALLMLVVNRVKAKEIRKSAGTDQEKEVDLMA